MALPTFFYTGELIQGATIELSQAESLHATKSRRLPKGQLVNVINGRGFIAQGELDSTQKRHAQVLLSQVEQRPDSRIKLTLATAVPKGDRQKIMLDMLTQLGVNRIIPLACDYSVSKFDHRALEKWQRACMEACKQSQRVYLPEVSEQHNVEACIAQYSNNNHAAKIVYADFEGGHATDLALSNEAELVVMVGPEGGFSEREQALFAQHKLNGLYIAANILRTETASVAAAAQLINML